MRLLFLFIILTVTGAAQYQGNIFPDKELDECLRTHNSSDGIILCYNEALNNWDKRLNEVYTELKMHLDEKEKAVLLKAQRNWLAFRDAEYELIDEIYTDKPGSIWLETRVYRRMMLTKERTLTLEALLFDKAEY
jgi:uncharacterized protein YecT (DUF1311 family)